MDTATEKIMTDALALPAEDRALVAERLIESLDSLNAVETEQLWLDEAERRYLVYKQGGISARLAEDVLRDARSAIG